MNQRSTPTNPFVETRRTTLPAHAFVDRWRLEAAPQPFYANRVRMYGFVFRADPHRLDALVKRWLGHPGCDYDAIESFPYVLVVFTESERMGSCEAPYHDCGHSRERELAIWVPVHDWARLLWHTPYIFVDNPWACVQGREIYGFPKEIAEVYVAPPDEPDRFGVKAFAIDTFDANSRMDWADVLNVKATPDSTVRAAGGWKSFDDCASECNNMFCTHLAARSLREILHSDLLASIGNVIEFPWPPRGKLVFLKQFPDGVDGSRACYKSVTECSLEVEQFRGGGLLEATYELELPANDSHPIFSDLGVFDGQQAEFGYWLDFDFTMTGAAEVWRAAPGEEGELITRTGPTGPWNPLGDFAQRLWERVSGWVSPWR